MEGSLCRSLDEQSSDLKMVGFHYGNSIFIKETFT